MNAYRYCPLTKEECDGDKCALYVEYHGAGGCALRGLIALERIAVALENR
jgi:hypothetical protein